MVAHHLPIYVCGGGRWGLRVRPPSTVKWIRDLFLRYGTHRSRNMNVLIYTASSAPAGPTNVLRSVLSPFYAVQNVTSTTLATQPWGKSCALLILSSPPDVPGSLSLPSQAHAIIQQYIATGGRLLAFGLGVSTLSH